MGKSARLGQNFLRDGGAARRIVDLVPPGNGPLLEIGAGKGILSERLVGKFPGRRIALVEIDAFLLAELERRFHGRAEILHQDILQLDLAALFPGETVTLVGNLPYHISKALIDWIIAWRRSIAGAVLMLQKDFIDKLLAAPGSKKYNAQSVAFQLLFDVRRAFDVPAGAFVPRPKVVSTVITARLLEPIPPDFEAFYGFVGSCFAGRRKTLWNNLAPGRNETELSAALAAVDIPGQARAEQLEPERFLALWSALGHGQAESCR